MIKKSLAVLSAAALFGLLGSTPALAGSIPAGQSKAVEVPVDVDRGADGATVVTGDSLQLTVLPAEEREGETTAAGGDMSIQAATISCTLKVHYPHGSHHRTGTINGEATTTCTGGNMALLSMHYSLIRVSPNQWEWAAAPKTAYDVSKLKINRAVSCSMGPGNFRGWAQLTATPPAGYRLVTPAVVKTYGPIVAVRCGSAATPVSIDPTEAAETLEFTFERID